MILKNLVFGLIIFGMVCFTFFVIPITGGFWSAYGYSTTANTSQYQTQSEINQMTMKMKCDMTPTAAGCPSVKNNFFSTIIEGGTSFVDAILKGGYAAIITLMDSLGFTEVIGETVKPVLARIGVDPFFVSAFLGLVIFAFILAFLYMIFNKAG